MGVDLGIDESGSGDVLVVSVQTGVVEKARKMKSKWRTELRKSGVKFFHSVDYDNATKGIFKHLDRTKRKILLQSLSGNLRKRMLFGMTAKLTISSYNEKTDNKFRSQWAAAYPFAIQVLMLYVHLVMASFGLGDEINVLIEDGHKNAGQALDILQRMKKARDLGHNRIPLRVLTAGLGSKIDNPILQAADMLGYSEWQNLCGVQGDIYRELHVGSSRYQVGYIDLDKKITDIALDIAQRSDKAKALVRQYEWVAKSPNPSKETIDEIVTRIQEFRQNYEEVDDSFAQRDQSSTVDGKDSKGD
jgi:hypothetical protein